MKKQYCLIKNQKSDIKDSFKYFIGYRHRGDAFPSPLYIKLPHMNTHVKYIDKNNKCIDLLVNDKEIFKKIFGYMG